jgi:hypothetical protein
MPRNKRIILTILFTLSFKANFIGKKALEESLRDWRNQRLTMLEVDVKNVDPEGNESVWVAGRVRGHSNNTWHLSEVGGEVRQNVSFSKFYKAMKEIIQAHEQFCLIIFFISKPKSFEIMLQICVWGGGEGMKMTINVLVFYFPLSSQLSCVAKNLVRGVQLDLEF